MQVYDARKLLLKVIGIQTIWTSYKSHIPMWYWNSYNYKIHNWISYDNDETKFLEKFSWMSYDKDEMDF